VASVEWLGKRWPQFDPMGISVFMPSMTAAVKAVYPAYQNGFILGVGPAAATKTFLWTGIAWSPALIGTRLLWVLIALVLVLPSALFFSRFDPSRERARTRKAKAAQPVMEQPASLPASLQPQVRLTPLNGTARFTFGRRLLAELRLMLKGQKWWWYVVSAGLVIAPLTMPSADATKVLLVAWVWPVLVWSGMGCREARNQTAQIVFSAARPISSQLPVTWLAGVVVSLLMAGGVVARYLLAGDASGLAALLAGAFFIPSLALALGAWTGGSKAFEIVYLLLWYIGPMNQTPGLDYMGVGAEKLAVKFALLAMGLAAAALVGRRKQIDQ